MLWQFSSTAEPASTIFSAAAVLLPLLAVLQAEDRLQARFDIIAVRMGDWRRFATARARSLAVGFGVIAIGFLGPELFLLAAIRRSVTVRDAAAGALVLVAFITLMLVAATVVCIVSHLRGPLWALSASLGIVLIYCATPRPLETLDSSWVAWGALLGAAAFGLTFSLSIGGLKYGYRSRG